ncbi:MAG TPA: hypothetical protein VH325_00620 [Bryobacteraceae bacterium]|nr:hypothetical protein [Bryobacteraceae bacterium]
MLSNLPDFVPAFSHHLKPLKRHGSQFAGMLFHPRINVFTLHVNVGCAALPNPARLLQGNGKFMRHVRLRSGTDRRRCRNGKGLQ